MVKAPAYGAGDSRFESWCDRLTFFSFHLLRPRFSIRWCSQRELIVVLGHMRPAALRASTFILLIGTLLAVFDQCFGPNRIQNVATIEWSTRAKPRRII